MSSIRKLRRYKSLHKKQNVLSKLSLGEIVFYVGIAAMLFGLFYGIFYYNAYISGRPEQTTESRGGPIYNPKEAPGNMGHRESATVGWIIAGIGLLLIISSMFISIIVELLQDAIGKLRGRTGERQHIRKEK